MIPMNTPNPHCEYCGAPLPLGARFCEACGQPVRTAPSAATPPAPAPASYQAALPATPPPSAAAYQAALPPTPAPARPVSAPSYTLPPTPAADPFAEKPKNKWLLPACLGGAGCLLVLCLALIVGGYLLFNSAEWDTAMETIMPAVLETQAAVVEPAVPGISTPTALPAGIITATAVPLPKRPGLSTATPIAPPTEVPPLTEVVISAAIWPADIGQELTATYFSDDFSNASFVTWEGGEDGISTWEYVEGRFQGHLFVTDYMAWTLLPVDFSPTAIGFDAAIVPGFEQGAYGVLCHYQDNQNFYFVSLDPWYHEYSIGYLQNDEFFELMQDMWLESTTLFDDPYAVNSVQVVCDPDQITLFVNNQLEAQVDITRIEGGQAGIYVETWTDTPAEGFKAQFDNLYAYIPQQ
jgi:hypothetical protein